MAVIQFIAILDYHKGIMIQHVNTWSSYIALFELLSEKTRDKHLTIWRIVVLCILS